MPHATKRAVLMSMIMDPLNPILTGQHAPRACAFACAHRSQFFCLPSDMASSCPLLLPPPLAHTSNGWRLVGPQAGICACRRQHGQRQQDNYVQDLRPQHLQDLLQAQKEAKEDPGPKAAAVDVPTGWPNAPWIRPGANDAACTTASNAWHVPNASHAPYDALYSASGAGRWQHICHSICHLLHQWQPQQQQCRTGNGCGHQQQQWRQRCSCDLQGRCHHHRCTCWQWLSGVHGTVSTGTVTAQCGVELLLTIRMLTILLCIHVYFYTAVASSQSLAYPTCIRSGSCRAMLLFLGVIGPACIMHG